MPSTVDKTSYPLDNVDATALSGREIDETFRSSCIDLVSSALGGKVLARSDEWFADATNLLLPHAPVSKPGKMVFSGQWMDGWETRRHNRRPFDWVVIRLGVASGTVTGAEADTAFFTGNYGPAVSVEGCFSSSDEEVVSWEGERGRWETILGVQHCGPSRRFGWKIAAPSSKAYTHVRLNMYPDGGIARFRLWGHAVPVFPDDKAAIFDLAAAQNGGIAVSCSDEHYTSPSDLLLPGRGSDMSEGWHTERSREVGHSDWAIIRLGAPGYIRNFVADTAHYRGNFPQQVAIEALAWTGGSGGEPDANDSAWRVVVAPTDMGPDREHDLPCVEGESAFTHVKLIIIPDGGLKRLRVFGRRSS
ncbi:allantoicase [Purpureocillium lilacinum]|uniref:allantoicase n=1 Tax=Purpureocillium lilacinum TaxID=33203 RepID=UPI0020871C0F|nr:allantoicase [Purpureocillium lilacinum]GJN81571.1 allantoicase [Purpureocillium lilacinum]